MNTKLFNGGVSTDDRGSVRFVNDFNFVGVKRFYQIENHSKGFIRAWHGHLKEGKYFYVAKGSALVGAMNLDHEVEDLVLAKDLIQPERYILSANKPSILFIPPNFANGTMNLEDNTIILVFSTSTLEESLKDDIRIPWNKWNIWTPEYR